jgi:hypothetical protein
VRGHQYTIDRWDDATGENLVEEIRARGVRVLLLSPNIWFWRPCSLEVAPRSPRAGLKRKLSASCLSRQPGYTLWTMIQWAIMAS